MGAAAPLAGGGRRLPLLPLPLLPLLPLLLPLID